jgi:hypothetical protein
MAARQALECEEDHSNSVIKITNCLRMSASMQAPAAPAESQIPATKNHPLTIKAASWRVLIANQ